MSQVTGNGVVFIGGEYAFEFETNQTHMSVHKEVIRQLGDYMNVLVYFRFSHNKCGCIYERVGPDQLKTRGNDRPPPEKVIAWLNLMGYFHYIDTGLDN